MSPHQQEAVAVWIDVAELGSDAAVLDALARLALDLKRSGYRLCLRNASRDLTELIELSGLSEVLPSRLVTPGSIEPRC